MAYEQVTFPASAWDGSFASEFRQAGEIAAVQNELLTPNSGNGAAAGTGVVAAEGPGYNVLKRTVLTITGLSVTMTDATTAGCHGSQKVYDFPAGVIQVLGCTTNLTIARGGTNIGATAAVVGAVGTAAVGTDNATLTGTEADIVPSTAGTLTDGAGTVKGKSTATEMAAGVWDGTSAAKDAYLNFAVPDADSAGNDTLTVNGTITLTWVNHGDN